MKTPFYYTGKLFGKLVDKQSEFWNIVKSPTLRYAAFRDPLDTLIYALSVSYDKLFFIQVGSNDATYGDPLQIFLNDKHWSGIMVEPVNYVFNRLAARYGKSQRFILENVAIAEVNGTKDFYHLEESEDDLPVWYDQLGSFSLPAIMKHAECIPDLDKRIKASPVECITFSTLCDRNSVRNIDLIHIDTEGFDYEILKLIDFQHFRPTLLIYEHKHLSEIDKFAACNLLANNGYEVKEISFADAIAVSSEALKEARLLQESWDIFMRTA
ncbi:FkbM family methyltransferase [Leptothermofonsia sichuanensis E412]|uniref:FkbM family methyltransferase n=1 Tax=Leptothermofonsia sichuanensis TaxID=2917832 RepID=UPI001CA75E37|nr:FkbM family methyltransferase [Leptothermofonsia sichuanensis]QZZ22088.1 FkbM family methyltransferase [Leptothermofonsia sichuanensis E412]